MNNINIIINNNSINKCSYNLGIDEDLDEDLDENEECLYEDLDENNECLYENDYGSTIDFSLNDTYEDQFMYLIDLAIEYGDVRYMYDAIENYKDKINESYIKWANNLVVEIIEEKIQVMEL